MTVLITMEWLQQSCKNNLAKTIPHKKRSPDRVTFYFLLHL